MSGGHSTSEGKQSQGSQSIWKRVGTEGFGWDDIRWWVRGGKGPGGLGEKHSRQKEDDNCRGAVRNAPGMFQEHERKWSEVAQSCPTLWDPMDCNLPGSSIHGIFQARVLEWVAISFSRGSSRPRDLSRVSHIAGRCFTIWATRVSEAFYVRWIWEQWHKNMWLCCFQ